MRACNSAQERSAPTFVAFWKSSARVVHCAGENMQHVDGVDAVALDAVRRRES